MLSRGVSLNIMSLGGLALGVGMLVDNSIVVLEAIHRRARAATGPGRRRVGRSRRRRGGRRGHRLDPDHAGGVRAHRLRGGRGRADLPRPGADGDVLAGRFAAGLADVHADGRPVAAAAAACAPGAGATCGLEAGRRRHRRSPVSRWLQLAGLSSALRAAARAGRSPAAGCCAPAGRRAARC